jgi:hypothetical protein
VNEIKEKVGYLRSCLELLCLLSKLRQITNSVSSKHLLFERLFRKYPFLCDQIQSRNELIIGSCKAGLVEFLRLLLKEHLKGIKDFLSVFDLSIGSSDLDDFHHKLQQKSFIIQKIRIKLDVLL